MVELVNPALPDAPAKAHLMAAFDPADIIIEGNIVAVPVVAIAQPRAEAETSRNAAGA